MCDVHLCEPAMVKMAEVGPLTSIVAVPDKVVHLVTCEDCAKKFAAILELAAMKVEPDKVS